MAGLNGSRVEELLQQLVEGQNKANDRLASMDGRLLAVEKAQQETNTRLAAVEEAGKETVVRLKAVEEAQEESRSLQKILVNLAGTMIDRLDSLTGKFDDLANRVDTLTGEVRAIKEGQQAFWQTLKPAREAGEKVIVLEEQMNELRKRVEALEARR